MNTNGIPIQVFCFVFGAYLFNDNAIDMQVIIRLWVQGSYCRVVVMRGKVVVRSRNVCKLEPSSYNNITIAYL